MSDKELIIQGERIIQQLKEVLKDDNLAPIYHIAPQQEAMQFLADYAGEASRFYQGVTTKDYSNAHHGLQTNVARVSMEAFLNYLKNGLMNRLSPKREAQIEVVSDILEQANLLLQDNKVHPAAPMVLIGAALEEFLRNWVEEEKMELGALKATIDSYAKLLREKNLITKQDKKDIDAWAGHRNNAAHGHWEEVSNKQLANIMLQGVNLFIRRYTLD